MSWSICILRRIAEQDASEEVKMTVIGEFEMATDNELEALALRGQDICFLVDKEQKRRKNDA